MDYKREIYNISRVILKIAPLKRIRLAFVVQTKKCYYKVKKPIGHNVKANEFD